MRRRHASASSTLGVSSKKQPYKVGTYRLRVRRSQTGLGLFTEELIPKGVCILEYTGRVISRSEVLTSRSKYLFEISNRKTIDGSARANTARYINHSCRPNCLIEIKSKRVFIFSKRAIKKGEELTYDYDKEYFDEYIKAKGCRCIRCRA